MIYALYEDDGPKGICGQSCEITRPWKILVRVDSYDEIREMQRAMENDGAMSGRINPHISWWFSMEYDDRVIYGAEPIVDKSYILPKQST